jgi:glucokinase
MDRAGKVAGVAEGCVIGVDLGGTKLLAGAVDADLTVHHRTNRPALGLDQAELVEMVVHAVESVRNGVGGEVSAVGFGIPCTFDAETGTAVQAVNLPLHDIRFAEVMAERLDLPVVVDNDANCAVLAEARAGAAAGSSEVVMLTLGTGIGGGLYLRGELYRGFQGGGAELGHMVVDMDGRPCQGSCPNWGCLESVASGSALVREASLATARRPDTELGRALEAGRELTGPMVTQLARDGDAVACGAIQVVGRALGVGIANLVNIFNPQVVVIGGGVSEAGDLLLDPAREVMLRRALLPGRESVRVAAAAFGAEAGMIGAALLARERPEGIPLSASPAGSAPSARSGSAAPRGPAGSGASSPDSAEAAA